MPNQQFGVIGLGRFGARVASGLYEAGAEVIAIDEAPERVDAIKANVTTAICADATSADVLSELEVQELDGVVVAMGRDVEASILITAQLKRMGARNIVARASSELHAQILSMVGADRVVYPEHDAGMRVVRQLTSPHVVEFITLEGPLDFAVLTIPDNFVNHTLRDLQLPTRYGITVVSIRSADGQMRLPDPDYSFGPHDTVYVVGNAESMQRLSRLMEK